MRADIEAVYDVAALLRFERWQLDREARKNWKTTFEFICDAYAKALAAMVPSTWPIHWRGLPPCGHNLTLNKGPAWSAEWTEHRALVEAMVAAHTKEQA